MHDKQGEMDVTFAEAPGCAITVTQKDESDDDEEMSGGDGKGEKEEATGAMKTLVSSGLVAASCVAYTLF